MPSSLHQIMFAMRAVVFCCVICVPSLATIAADEAQPAAGAAKENWQPAPADKALPGMIPAPAELPGIGRWQMIPAQLRSFVRGSAFSPDGRRVAFGDGARVRICTVEQLQLSQVLVGHTGRVNAICWNEATGKIATGSSDGTVRIWSTEGAPGPVLKGHTGGVRDVSWKADGSQLVSAGIDGTLRIWNADGTPTKTITGHLSPVNCVAWSPMADLIAAGDDNRTVHIWKTDGSAHVPPMQGHRGPIMSVSWKPDGTELVSGCQGYDSDDEQDTAFAEVRIWSADGKELHLLQGHDGPVHCVRWSPDGKTIASVGWGANVLLWNENGERIGTLQEGGYLSFTLAWSPDSNELVSGGRNRVVTIWNVSALTPKVATNAGRVGIQAVACSPDSKWIASAGLDRMVRVWPVNGGTPEVFEGHTAQVHSVAWTPDGKQLASASDDGTRRIWNLDGSPGPVIEEGQSRSVAYSPDGKLLATASGNSVQIFDADGALKQQLAGHTHGVTRLAWSPDGSQLASAAFDSSVRIWNVDGSAGAILQAVSAPTRAVAWNPDGKTIASGHEDGSVRLWSPDGNELQKLSGHDDYVEVATYSPDGKWLATGSWDGTVRIWDADGKPVLVYAQHSAPVFGLSWMPDSKSIASAGVDNTIRVWDAQTGETKQIALPLENNGSMTFSAAGQLLSGDASQLEAEFIYLVEGKNGAMQVVSANDFQKQLTEHGLAITASPKVAANDAKANLNSANPVGGEAVGNEKSSKADPGKEAKLAQRRGKIVTALKQIALAMHLYHEEFGTFAPRASYDANSNALLSWRVQLLPYLGDEAKKLHAEFHFDEPWDSDHNKALIPRMPAVFAAGSDELQKEGKTIYLVPVGKDTPFETREGCRVKDIIDGTSNTIMFVAADDQFAVTWTKPDDWQCDEANVFKGLLENETTDFRAALCDGSNRQFSASIEPKKLRTWLTYKGREIPQE